MRKLLSAALAIVTLLAVPNAASARGNYSDPFENGSCCEVNEGFYIGGIGGVSWSHDSYWKDSQNVGGLLRTEYEAGFQAGGFLGYRFCNGLRIEGEISYRELDFDKGIYYNGSGTISESNLSRKDWTLVTYMGNLLYECSYQTCGCCLKPYFGAGAGTCQVDVDLNYDISGYSLSYKEDDWVFAYQLIVGVDVPVSECMDIGLSYRYLVLDAPHYIIAGRRIEANEWIGHHNLSAVIKYTFGYLL